jgi:hypothetical protein
MSSIPIDDLFHVTTVMMTNESEPDEPEENADNGGKSDETERPTPRPENMRPSVLPGPSWW